MNREDELARTTSLLEELERLVATGTLTRAQLDHLDGSVLPPLFVRLRILRRGAFEWISQAQRQLELSELGWHRMPEPAPGPSVLALARTITALYDDGHRVHLAAPRATGWAFSDYGMGPALAEERSSRGLVLLLAAGAAFWLAKGKRR